MSPVRFLASLLASVLLVASAVAIDRTRSGDGGADATAAPSPRDQDTAPSAPRSPTPGPAPTATPPDPLAEAGEQLRILTSTDAAAAAGADALLEAGLVVAQGPWRTLTDPAWPVRDHRPVYVAEARIADGAERVEADVVIAWRQEEAAERLVLRSLAASTVLQQAGGALETTVSLDGEEVAFDEDGDGARIIVAQPLAAGSAHLLRVTAGFDLVDGAGLAGDGGPAGFGLLARHAGSDARSATANLGHWLPLLTHDQEPMVAWGDVGAFPTAIWSVLVTHPGSLVTGGDDGECPRDYDAEQACTWARGVALRDVSAVWFAENPATGTERAGGLEINAHVPAGTFERPTLQQVLLEAAGSVEVFATALGPLAWREFDVVGAPLLEGAAGMEFPGLVIIDLEVFGSLQGQFGTYVLAHEVAHQWFHALVGNGSLSSPVIDESLAQYLSYLFWAEAFGQEAADRLAQDAFRDRYAAARQRGLDDEPPAQPLADFDGDAAYGPLVYARAPLAFVEAESELGRPRVLDFLSQLVDRHGLGFLSDDELLEQARSFDGRLGAVLERYWFDPTPIAGPSG